MAVLYAMAFPAADKYMMHALSKSSSSGCTFGIRALILDIDGVLVGNMAGYNFPNPHLEVTKALRAVRQKGIYVSLCTARPAFAIEKIIRDAYLDNVHITDGGAVIVNPIDTKIAEVHSIPNELAIRLARFYQDKGVYQEFNTVSDYYIAADQVSELTTKHALTLQRQPELVMDMEAFLKHKTFVKIFLIAKDEAEKALVVQSFTDNFSDTLMLSWTLHPNTLPWQFGIVTAKGVSKQQGALEIAQHVGVPLRYMLGVGDTVHDWQFMTLCGYVAATANATDELKSLVQARGEQGMIGPSVNENGIITILHHFAVL